MIKLENPRIAVLENCGVPNVEQLRATTKYCAIGDVITLHRFEECVEDISYSPL